MLLQLHFLLDLESLDVAHCCLHQVTHLARIGVLVVFDALNQLGVHVAGVSKQLRELLHQCLDHCEHTGDVSADHKASAPKAFEQVSKTFFEVLELSHSINEHDVSNDSLFNSCNGQEDVNLAPNLHHHDPVQDVLRLSNPLQVDHLTQRHEASLQLVESIKHVPELDCKLQVEPIGHLFRSCKLEVGGKTPEELAGRLLLLVHEFFLVLKEDLAQLQFQLDQEQQRINKLLSLLGSQYPWKVPRLRCSFGLVLQL